MRQSPKGRRRQAVLSDEGVDPSKQLGVGHDTFAHDQMSSRKYPTGQASTSETSCFEPIRLRVKHPTIWQKGICGVASYTIGLCCSNREVWANMNGLRGQDANA